MLFHSWIASKNLLRNLLGWLRLRYLPIPFGRFCSFPGTKCFWGWMVVGSQSHQLEATGQTAWQRPQGLLQVAAVKGQKYVKKRVKTFFPFHYHSKITWVYASSLRLFVTPFPMFSAFPPAKCLSAGTRQTDGTSFCSCSHWGKKPPLAERCFNWILWKQSSEQPCWKDGACICRRRQKGGWVGPECKPCLLNGNNSHFVFSKCLISHFQMSSLFKSLNRLPLVLDYLFCLY